MGRGSAGAIYEPRLSGDGRILAFSAADAGTDGRALVFVRDVANGATTLVSRAGADGASADDDAYEPSISDDGRYVAFTSAAGNLGADGHRSRIWVRDVQSDRVEQISGKGFAFDPSISADGRFVAYAERPTDGSGRADAGQGDGVALRPRDAHHDADQPVGRRDGRPHLGRAGGLLGRHARSPSRRPHRTSTGASPPA